MSSTGSIRSTITLATAGFQVSGVGPRQISQILMCLSSPCLWRITFTNFSLSSLVKTSPALGSGGQWSYARCSPAPQWNNALVLWSRQDYKDPETPALGDTYDPRTRWVWPRGRTAWSRT